jgi:hypothetical protein
MKTVTAYDAGRRAAESGRWTRKDYAQYIALVARTAQDRASMAEVMRGFDSVKKEQAR